MIRILFVSMFISGCATHYGPWAENSSGGYVDGKTGRDTWRVAFGGNGHTSYESVLSMTKRRGNELCLEMGYNHTDFLKIWTDTYKTQNNLGTCNKPMYINSSKYTIWADIRCEDVEYVD